MTFSRYYTEIKQILGIESLTEAQSRDLLCLYLTRVSVEEAAKRMKEK